MRSVRPFSRGGLARARRLDADHVIAIALRGLDLPRRSILALHRAALVACGDRGDGQRAPFADALFTAVSTICVTGLSTVDMATYWSPLGHADHLHRRQRRRAGRPDPGLDPRAHHLEAPGSAREAHRRRRHESDARPRRSGQRGPDGASRRGRRAAGYRRPLDPRDRGGARGPAVSVAADRRRGPADGPVGGAVLRRDGLHEHRLHPEPRRAGALRAATTSSSRS